MSGAQLDPFVDIVGGTKALGVRRTYTSFTLNEQYSTRPAWPEVLNGYTPFGAGWFWDYGMVIVTPQPMVAPGLKLIDKDGLIKYFHRNGSDRVWENDRGEGQVTALNPEKVVLTRSTGERVTFQRLFSTASGHYWFPVEIERPQDDLVITLEYPTEATPESDKGKVARIFTNTGGELRLTWSPSVQTPLVYTPRNTVGPTRVLTLSKIEFWSNNGLMHTLDYLYEDLPVYGGAFRQLKEVYVDSQLRWSYTNLIKPVSSTRSSVLLRSFSNGRGDTVSFSWGPNLAGDAYRGSRMVGADGKVYQDSRITWALSGEALTTTIKTLADRSGTLKSQQQVYEYSPYEMRNARIRRPSHVSGPGCSVCGVASNESYTYDPYTGQMATKCDADGVLTRTVYDDFGNIEVESLEVNAPGCPTPPYIVPVAGLVTTTTQTLHRNVAAPGASTITFKPSVFGSDASTGTISDYDDPISDPTPLVPNDWWPVAKIQREIRYGQTRSVDGTLHSAEYATQYRYYDWGFEVDGPRLDADDRTVVTYHLGTSNVHYRDQIVGPGPCPGAGCLRTTYEEYDALGNPLLVIAPSGLETRFVYNGWNKLAKSTQIVDGQTLATTYEYDAAGDLDKVILPEGNVVDYDYVGPSLLVSVKRLNSLGGPVIDEMIYEYDPEGNRTQERRYLGSAGTGVLT